MLFLISGCVFLVTAKLNPNQVRVQRCRLADKCSAETEQRAKDKRKRLGIFGDEFLSKTAGIWSKSKGNLLYSEEEVGNIVRVGCCSPGASRSAIAATAETVFIPILRKTVHFWRWSCFYAMCRIGRGIILDFTSGEILGVLVRFDVSPLRLWGVKNKHTDTLCKIGKRHLNAFVIICCAKNIQISQSSWGRLSLF